MRLGFGDGQIDLDRWVSMVLDERFRRLDVELKQAVRLHMWLRGSRRRKQRALAEYNLGVASGIMKTLDLLGYESWKEEVLRQLDQEFPSPVECVWDRRVAGSWQDQGALTDPSFGLGLYAGLESPGEARRSDDRFG